MAVYLTLDLELISVKKYNQLSKEKVKVNKTGVIQVVDKVTILKAK